MPWRFRQHRSTAPTPAAAQARESRRWDKGFTASRRWRRLRALQLSEFPLCAECERQGEVTLASQVDHLQPRRERPDLTFVQTNLESLCASCHAKKTAAERSAGRI